MGKLIHRSKLRLPIRSDMQRTKKVRGWLLTSMSLEIMKRYLWMHIVREIWSAFTKTFYDGSNETHLFALNQYAFTIKHAGRPLSTYYVELVEIFQELDYYDKVIMKYLDDIVTYKKFITWLRVHIFFSGLNTHFE